MIVNNEYIGIFNLVKFLGFCRYEVVYINIFLIGKNIVCFMVW